MVEINWVLGFPLTSHLEYAVASFVKMKKLLVYDAMFYAVKEISSRFEYLVTVFSFEVFFSSVRFP